MREYFAKTAISFVVLTILAVGVGFGLTMGNVLGRLASLGLLF